MRVYSDKGLIAYMKKMAGERWEELRHIVIEKLLTNSTAQQGASRASEAGKLNRYAAKVVRNAWMDIVAKEQGTGGDYNGAYVDIEQEQAEMTARQVMEGLEKEALKYIYKDFTNAHSPNHFKALYFVASIKAGSNRALSRTTGIPEKAIRLQKREYLKIIHESLNR